MGSLRKCVLAGGDWANASNAGVFNRNLNNYRTNSNNNVGLAADYASSSKRASAQWSIGIGCPALGEITRGGVFSRLAPKITPPINQ